MFNKPATIIQIATWDQLNIFEQRNYQNARS